MLQNLFSSIGDYRSIKGATTGHWCYTLPKQPNDMKNGKKAGGNVNDDQSREGQVAAQKIIKWYY